MVKCPAHTGSTVHNLITHKYFLNVSVSHKKESVSLSHKIIQNVSVSHKIVIYRVFLRGADRGPTGARWITCKQFSMDLSQKQKKTGIRVFYDLQTFIV